MVLHINTTDQYQVTVSLKDGSKMLREVVEHNQFGSQVLLPMIQKVLTEDGKELGDLKEIQVAIGPGSFTGIRVGVSVANALGFALKIPVNGKEFESEIHYG